LFINSNGYSDGNVGNSGYQDNRIERESTFDGPPVGESVSLLSDFDEVSTGARGLECWKRPSQSAEPRDVDDSDGESAEPRDDDDEAMERGGESWVDILTYAERVKLNLARALVMNPEVLVLQRPFHDGGIATLLLEVIHEFVRERGVCMLPGSAKHRVSRTCFFTPENLEQAAKADVIWEIDDFTNGVVEITKEQARSRERDLAIRAEPSVASRGRALETAAPPAQGTAPSVGRLASPGLSSARAAGVGHQLNSAAATLAPPVLALGSTPAARLANAPR